MLHLLRVARSLVREVVKDASRSTHWPTVRDRYLENHPICAACCGTKLLQIHHIQPFYLFPQLELDPQNLVTLCMGKLECHLRAGHLYNWKAYNPDVRSDASLISHLPATHRAAFLESLKSRAPHTPHAPHGPKTTHPPEAL